MLLLGDKVNGEPFDTEDLRILETWDDKPPSSRENVQLVSSFGVGFLSWSNCETNWRSLHHRLLFSREDERKYSPRIARPVAADLPRHDGDRGPVRSHKDTLQMVHLMALEKWSSRPGLRNSSICASYARRSGIAGLAATIRSYTEQWAEQHPDVRVIGGFPDPVPNRSQASRTIRLDLARDRKRLPDEIEITLFRVYQEALANISRHAEARNVWGTERLTDDHIELVIGDDGGGFTLPARLDEMARLGHFGLLGIRERIAAVGGKARITSEPGQGTEIRVTVPLDKGERKWERRP